METNDRKILIPPGSPQPVSYYSHGIRVGTLLYSAGQTSRNEIGQLVGIGDASYQARQAFHNLSLVLAEGEMSLSDIVRINLFLRYREDIPSVLSVMETYFGGIRQALTVTIVKSLAFREYLLEVEAIASLE